MAVLFGYFIHVSFKSYCSWYHPIVIPGMQVPQVRKMICDKAWKIWGHVIMMHQESLEVLEVDLEQELFLIWELTQ